MAKSPTAEMIAEGLSAPGFRTAAVRNVPRHRWMTPMTVEGAKHRKSCVIHRRHDIVCRQRRELCAARKK
jgi:hypothetical protein